MKDACGVNWSIADIFWKDSHRFSANFSYFFRDKEREFQPILNRLASRFLLPASEVIYAAFMPGAKFFPSRRHAALNGNCGGDAGDKFTFRLQKI
jgi:hypothetical protein